MWEYRQYKAHTVSSLLAPCQRPPDTMGSGHGHHKEALPLVRRTGGVCKMPLPGHQRNTPGNLSSRGSLTLPEGVLSLPQKPFSVLTETLTREEYLYGLAQAHRGHDSLDEYDVCSGFSDDRSPGRQSSLPLPRSGLSLPTWEPQTLLAV
jgi:hypothetical protein